MSCTEEYQSVERDFGIRKPDEQGRNVLSLDRVGTRFYIKKK